MIAAVSIREAVERDLPAIVALLADDFLGRTRDAVEADMAPYRAAFAAIAADRNNEMIVMESGGRVVGCCQITIIPGLSNGGALRGQIESVRIDSSLRGRGFGRTLIRYCIQICKARGCRTVQLTTNKQRSDARRFYEKLGFVASHEGMKYEITHGHA